MPILTGVYGSFQLSFFPNIGDDKNFGMPRQIEVADDMRFQRAELPAESDMLIRPEMDVTKEQAAALRESALQSTDDRRYKRSCHVDAGDFRAAGGRIAGCLPVPLLR